MRPEDWVDSKNVALRVSQAPLVVGGVWIEAALSLSVVVAIASLTSLRVASHLRNLLNHTSSIVNFFKFSPDFGE